MWRAKVISITIELQDNEVDALRSLAAAEQRSEADILRTALAAYSSRPLPKGMGKYQSGRSDTSKKAREILRDEVREGRWP